MPMLIRNNIVNYSMCDIMRLMKQGYSVLKSPHIGNLSGCDLLCASLGIPISLVTFTQGKIDKFFHPHLLIQDGISTQLSPADVWTPFAVTQDGVRVEDLHLQSMREPFPAVSIRTDVQTMDQARDLAMIALAAVTDAMPDMWYRQVSSDGNVCKVSGDDKLVSPSSWAEIESDVFRFTSECSGWVVPNRFHIIFQLALQALSSGKSEIFHLAGQQMNGYICKIEKSLSKGYDAFRREYPELPETLIVNVVPIADCRLVTKRSNRVAVDDLQTALERFERLPNDQKRQGMNILRDAIQAHPSLVRPEEQACNVTQYDLTCTEDLVFCEWMTEVPVGRVAQRVNHLSRLAA